MSLLRQRRQNEVVSDKNIYWKTHTHIERNVDLKTHTEKTFHQIHMSKLNHELLILYIYVYIYVRCNFHKKDASIAKLTDATEIFLSARNDELVIIDILCEVLWSIVPALFREKTSVRSYLHSVEALLSIPRQWIANCEKFWQRRPDAVVSFQD